MAEPPPVIPGESFTQGSSAPPTLRRVLVSAVLLLVLMALAVWAASGFFARNHAKFLLNQRQYVEALAEIHELQDDGRDDARLLTLEAQALALMGNYDAAAEAGQKAVSTDDAPGEAHYWLALAQYQAGQTSESQASAAAFLQTGTVLRNGAQALARALAGERNQTPPPDLNGLPFRLLFPVEQGTWLGFAADEQAQSGNHGVAASLYRDAFIRGARNPRMMQRAVVSAALAGDMEAAQMFLDTSGTGAIQYAIEDLSLRQGFAGQPRLRVLGGGASAGGGALDAARALAWAHSRAMIMGSRHLDQETSSVFAGLHQQFPHDAAIRLSLADALSAAGDDSAARRIHEEVHSTQPTLETWLRLNAENIGGAELMKIAEPFIQRLDPISILTGEQVAVRSEETSDPNWPVRFYLASTLDGGTGGTVAVSLIMRSPAGSGAGMPVYIRTGDTENWSVGYAEGTGWSLSTIELTLEPGDNQIEISSALPGIAQPSEQLLPEFAGLIVTNPAGAIRRW